MDENEITLEGFVSTKAPISAKLYTGFSSVPAEYAELVVNLDWLQGALKGETGWASSADDRNKNNFRKDRYDSIASAIDSLQPLPMPELYFIRGRVTVMDGRHRLYRIIDLGFTHTRVMVKHKYVEAIATIADPDMKGDSFQPFE